MNEQCQAYFMNSIQKLDYAHLISTNFSENKVYVSQMSFFYLNKQELSLFLKELFPGRYALSIYNLYKTLRLQLLASQATKLLETCLVELQSLLSDQESTYHCTDARRAQFTNAVPVALLLRESCSLTVETDQLHCAIVIDYLYYKPEM